MQIVKTIGRNVLSNWTAFAMRAVTALLITPFLFRVLGDARYGVWIVAGSVVGAYGVLDMGMRGGLNQYLTRYLATANLQSANQTLNTAVAALTVVGGGIISVSLVVGLNVDSLFSVPRSLSDELAICIPVLGFAASIQMATFPFLAVLTAKQRHDLATIVSMSALTVRTIWTVTVLLSGGGLVALSWGAPASGLIEVVLRVVVARRLVPQLRLGTSMVSMPALRELWSFGVWSFLLKSSQTLGMHAMPIVIATTLQPDAVAVFGLATRVALECQAVVGMALMVFYPALVELDATERKADSANTVTVGSRLVYLLAVMILVIGTIWASDFFLIWLGEEAASGQYSVATIFQLLLVGVVFRQSPAVALQAGFASGRIRPLAIAAISEQVAALALAATFIPRFGLLAAPIAIVASSILVRFFIVLPLSLSIIRQDRWSFVRMTMPRPVLFGSLLVGFSYMLSRSVTADSLLLLATVGLVSASVAAALVYIIGLRQDERHYLRTVITTRLHRQRSS